MSVPLENVPKAAIRSLDVEVPGSGRGERFSLVSNPWRPLTAADEIKSSLAYGPAGL